MRVRLRARITAILGYVRFTSFDSTTTEGRSRERNRRLVLATASSGIARAVSLGATLVTIPLTFRYLGPERFGLWATLSSLIAILTFVDLGLGNGLLNAIAEADGRNDRKAALAYVSGSFFSLLSLALLLGASFALIYPHIRWEGLFNVSTPIAKAEAGPAVAVFVGCFLATMPLSVGQKVHMGLQDGFIAGVWTGAGALLGLLGVVAGVYVKAELPWLVLAVAGGPVLAALIGSLHLFLVQRPWLRPRISSVTRKAMHRVMGMGMMFFFLGLAGAVGYQSDNLVIAQLLGAAAVSQYAVPMKVFFFVPTLLGLVLAPLWPAYREAITRGEMDWVLRTFRRSVKLSVLVTTPPTLVLVLVGRDVIQLVAGDEIQPSLGLLLGLALWALLCSVSFPIAMLLNGMNAVKFQIVAASTMGVSNILVSVVLVHLVGVPGAVYGSVVTQFLCVVIPATLYLRRFFEAVNRDSAQAKLHWADVPSLSNRWSTRSSESPTVG